METALEKIRDQQKATWNKFSGGWAKWNELTMDFLKPMGDAIIQALKLADTDQVLDIATGTGEPGLTIAGIVTKGKVTGVDLSEDMLVIAGETASMRRIKNFETVVADCCALPFPDNSFDVVSCRMGFMFFPDMQLAAREMLRVLKPGGRMATSVWAGPEKNSWIAGVMGILAENIKMPAPPPDAPGMFRCAGKGFMNGLLSGAGFMDVVQEEITGFTNYESPEKFWEMMTEVAAPVVNSLANADQVTGERIHQGVLALFKNAESVYRLQFAATVCAARKAGV